MSETDESLIKAHILDMNQNGEEAWRACEAAMLSEEDANSASRKLYANEGVVEVIGSHQETPPSFKILVNKSVLENGKLVFKEEEIVAQHPEDRMLKGTIAGLKRGRAHLSNREARELFGHLGYYPGCKICDTVKGNMRRIRKKPNPYREVRPGCVWAMDMITWSHGSEEGNRYLVVLRGCGINGFQACPSLSKE